MKKIPILLFLLLSTAAMGADSWYGPRHKPGRTRGDTYSVAEPQTLILLGAGLVSLGIYAKRKNRKKT